MSEDWHAKLLAALECLAREADRLREEAAALSGSGQERSDPASDSDTLTLTRCIQGLA
jgi:hypothetical protein